MLNSSLYTTGGRFAHGCEHPHSQKTLVVGSQDVCFSRSRRLSFQVTYYLQFLDAVEIMDYLRIKGKNRFEDPKQFAVSFQKTVCSSYRLNKVVDSIEPF